MMKNLSPKSKLKGKGMVIAILFGLLAISTAAILGVRETEQKLTKDEVASNIIDNTASVPDESEAWKDAAASTVQETENTETMTKPKEESKTDTKKEEEAKPNTLTGFVLPVEGEIINPYSNGEMVKSLTLNDWRTHDGVDIAAKAATPVKACNAGKVESIENDPLWGMCITLTHPDGSKSYYMGLDNNIPVTKGQNVALGEVIGSVGTTAEIEQALDTHLHFAMKRDGNWVDPLMQQEK